MLGTEPADLPADDLVTEYTSGPFSAILKEDGETGGGDTPIQPGEDRGASPAAAGLAAVGAAAPTGRRRKRWSLALGLAVLIAAGITSELALLQHAAHQARGPVSPSRGSAPAAAASAAPTAPASARPTGPVSTAHPGRVSAAPSVSPTLAPAAVPAQQAAAAPADQRARLGHGDDRFRGWPPWPPGFRGWPILPFGPGDGLRQADHPGVLPGFGLPQPQRGFPQHW